jgi:hypothetical protein
MARWNHKISLPSGTKLPQTRRFNQLWKRYNTLTIRLHPLANTSSDLAVRNLCAELNTTETQFPGTELRLIYDLVSSKNL